MSSLIPTELLKQYQQASAGGARDIMSSAMQMAGNYLQGLKTMAGGQAGIPMKTMARQESDANIASTQQSIENAKRTLALNELQKYADLAGKTPDLVTINNLGLGDTFAPIADKNTAETDLNKQKLAVSWANANKSGSGGGGGSQEKIDKKTSSTLASGIMYDMENAWTRMVGKGNDPTEYSYKAHIDGAKARGVWDMLTAEDQLKVQTKANTLKKQKSN